MCRQVRFDVVQNVMFERPSQSRVAKKRFGVGLAQNLEGAFSVVSVEGVHR
jgi:hypothetical protein